MHQADTQGTIWTVQIHKMKHVLHRHMRCNVGCIDTQDAMWTVQRHKMKQVSHTTCNMDHVDTRGAIGNIHSQRKIRNWFIWIVFYILTKFWSSLKILNMSENTNFYIQAPNCLLRWPFVIRISQHLKMKITANSKSTAVKFINEKINFECIVHVEHLQNILNFN